MNIKKCSNCGYEMPGETRDRYCPICKTKFLMGYCSLCGEWREKLRDGRCRPCENKQHRAWREKQISGGSSQLKEWQDRISKIPKPYKTLTEDQWIEVCKHFSGCAYCGEPKIEARSMFMKFDQGGRYCAWNVLPACERCETLLHKEPNIFIKMNQKYSRSYEMHAKKFGYTLEKLNKITDYLGGKMDESMQSTPK